jgi:hypothetical protein
MQETDQDPQEHDGSLIRGLLAATPPAICLWALTYFAWCAL